MSRATGITLALLAAAVLTACDRTPLSGPPELRPGRDECVECGMLISEDRCCSALLVLREGRRAHLLFDDLGCMLDAERAGLRGATVIERHVRDYDARTWLRAADAVFLAASADQIATPMGSGMIACAAGSSRLAGAAALGAEVLDYAGLAALRKSRLDARNALAPPGQAAAQTAQINSPPPASPGSAAPAAQSRPPTESHPASGGGPRMDAYYLSTCAVCTALLGSRGVAHDFEFERRGLRVCSAECRATFDRDPRAALARLDAVMIADQLPHYPLTVSLLDGRALGAGAVDFIWGTRLFRAVDAAERDRILLVIDLALEKLDRAVLAAQAPAYGMPEKCPVQGDILPTDDKIDLVVANRMVRVCCARCARAVRARPWQYLAMVDYANRAAETRPAKADAAGNSARE